MVMERFRRLRKHIVYPESSLTPSTNPKLDCARAPVGSWCSPPLRGAPAPFPASSTPSPSEMELSAKKHHDHAFRRTVLQHQIQLFPPTPPPPYRFSLSSPVDRVPKEAPVIEIEMETLQPSPRKLINNEKRPKKEVEQVIELPQSPVPTSPSRKHKKGLVSVTDLCHPFTTMDPQGVLYICWLLTVTFSYSYNCWSIPLRATFPYQTPENTPRWMVADYICDVIYLIDLVLVKPRLMYLHEGFWVDDPVETRKNYRKKLQYKFDVISLLPLDILYVWLGTSAILVRLPRLLKLQTFWEFHQTMDRVLSSSYLVRIGKTLFYIFYLIHLNACAYYAMSVYEGIGINDWVFDGCGNAYIRCFYFATKTATSIGKNPKPENEAEYLFMTAAWLMGVFVFALLIGQIRDIIATATRAQTEYRKMVDGCSRYMRRLNMPPHLQRRVTAWFTFTWQQQRCFDESRILNTLPYNMKRDVALAVHMSTLSKVQLFRDCSASLLRDLVLQLRPVSFLPGDVVCRKGDVGNDMYIVKMGEVLVLSSDEREVLATLREGSVFGEISLLGIDGARRRTATVRSRGYSNLFALSKSDLELALRHHREAAHVLRRRADTIIRENAARQAAERGAGAGAGAGPGAGAGAGRKRRSASSHARRRPSALSHNKVCSTSLASSCSGMRTPLPTIVLTEE